MACNAFAKHKAPTVSPCPDPETLTVWKELGQHFGGWGAGVGGGRTCPCISDSSAGPEEARMGSSDFLGPNPAES